MTVSEIVSRLDLTVHAGDGGSDAEVARGYCSDMLSDVLGNAEEGSLWITIQKHQNIVAVAVMKSLACVVLAGGREPDPDTVAKADAEGVILLSSRFDAFRLAGELSALGIAGS